MDYIGDYIGGTPGVIKVDTRSLDYGSYTLWPEEAHYNPIVPPKEGSESP